MPRVAPAVGCPTACQQAVPQAAERELGLKMRSAYSEPIGLVETRQGLPGFVRRQVLRLAGMGLFTAVAFVLASVATWNVADPSLSHATANSVTNAGGYAGAVVADLAMQFFGLAVVAAVVPAVVWAWLLAAGRPPARAPRRIAAWSGYAVLAAGIFSCISPPETWPLPTGLGGVFGDMVLRLPGLLSGGYPTGLFAAVVALVLLAPASWMFWLACGLSRTGAPAIAPSAGKTRTDEDSGFDDDDGDDDYGFQALGLLTHWWLSARALLRRTTGFGMGPRGPAGRRREDDDDFLAAVVPGREGRMEPEFAGEMHGIGAAMHRVDTAFDDDDDEPLKPAPGPGAPAQSGMRVDAPVSAPKPGSRTRREAQASLIPSAEFELPSLHFLSEPRSAGRNPGLSKDALEQNARLLEGVLEDFGVKGEIIHVRPGPVVTLYELEPAPGVKSSRVIGLADDIARSMSAIAARVAVVPGRNAIGIELPNSTRETVYLRELLASRDFEGTKAKLALTLGKTINGEAVIADLAKMPHLLVAGTTGSGKSVAINTMILSLLYRMTPEQCRLIMIDPKMLELSVYDGVPHLLTPVVTDPKKAVVALKWTVREMEDRYRKMSKVGVRNIDGFNQRVAQAARKGERIARTVQTGFDRDTGEAIYETEELDLAPMPFIVVIIDEMADLMMVAGKDIEGAVQRLAQMARAAGIHVIMATQRPSVDVITGTIKANFPTRISFQVTSKIDSRTILGEQGAEQLLGMGDMLYMAGGGRIQRVHGPFVADEEVEKVVQHLKMQGVPEYLDSITEDDDDDGDAGSGGGGSPGNFGDSDDPYDQAVAVVLRDGKASTSYIQRRLGIGYNRAASIIERMEEEGIVGPANHAGKREILVPQPDEDVF